MECWLWLALGQQCSSMECYRILRTYLFGYQMQKWSFAVVFQPFVNEGEGGGEGAFLCRKAHQLGKLREALSLGKWMTFETRTLWGVEESSWSGRDRQSMSSLPCRCSRRLHGHRIRDQRP